jgi:hypothetical protein
MRTLSTFLLSAALAFPATAGTYDIRHGTITAPDDFVFKHTGTIDSYKGTLTRESDGFTIHFDIGLMAGAYMHEGKKANCSFFRQHSLGGLPASTGIEKVAGDQRIATTVGNDLQNLHGPANFWAVIRKDSDIADFLLIVTTYQAKSTDKPSR